MTYQGAKRGRFTAMVAVIAALFLGIPVVSGDIAAAEAAAAFTPTDDSYVAASQPDKNYGSRTSIRVDASPDRVSYIKFDVQGVGAPQSAALEINVESNGDGVDLYLVANTTWDESTITYNNQPGFGTLIGSTESVVAGGTYSFDVSAYVTGDALYSFGLATTDNTAIKIGSKEGGNSAVLHVPAPGAPPSPSPFLVTRVGTTYTAASQSTPSTYTGTLKSVVESAVGELGVSGGGTITFGADTFDLGADHFEFNGIADIVFEGAGMNLTVITNNSSAATDTEPFDVVGADRLTLRDFTVSANGSARSTSDVLDFDNGNDIVVENVRISASRGRGIVFDGKGSGWSANNNTVSGCVIDGIPGDGIELLASSFNTISGCTITDVGGHGIQMTKASTGAPQPNKKSSDNLLTGNLIDDSGRDGININSSDRNEISNNTVLNSADNVSSRDGIRLESNNGITCDDNEIDGNTASDNQPVKTQRYGISISSANCNRTVIGTNSLAGNLVGEISDNGTDTQYNLPPDTTPPTVPTNVDATALSPFEVEVTWDASFDAVGVTEYKVYRDTVEIASVGGGVLSYIDGTVAPETSYDYTVEAFDAAGNNSGQSSAATVTTPAAGGPITVNPTDDAYVDSTKPDRNYGNSSAMRIDGTPVKNAYLKFDVSGITGSVTSATVRIYAATGSSVGFDLSEVSDTSWTEGGITYNLAPSIGNLLGQSGSFSGGNYIDIDVTGYVTGDGLFSFAMETPHTTAIRFQSSEGANLPELVIIQSP